MLQEMAESGAKVLNAQAVEWARRAKIALHARKTADFPPAAGVVPKETVARPDRDGTAGVRAVAAMDRIALVLTDSKDMGRFLEATAELELPLVDAASAGGDASAVVPLLNVPDWEKRRSALEQRLGSAVRVTEGLAMISVVGDGLGTSAARAWAALAKLSPRSFGAGPLRISATLPAEHAQAAQRALHDLFVG